ncbi:hypothetical protein XACLE20_1510075 [Xanthomonas citri pv. citri]|nr:hypothetical protein XAC2911_810057 [Xanthomonas citri pv. citri]CEE73657.1 hypothetical protein XACLE20_1510075 [Xanthomonas citri pv. citri]CEH54271.1 hypothetical protein XACLE3_7240007 [Xanthomonas citri pv. citri]CEL48690.1 hypothetical protein XACJM35_2160031 [Xanthomonas citri pv. citri]
MPRRVAPSRARGLKHVLDLGVVAEIVSRALTGAWIETPSCFECAYPRRSRALTGAWIETRICD